MQTIYDDEKYFEKNAVKNLAVSNIFLINLYENLLTENPDDYSAKVISERNPCVAGIIISHEVDQKSGVSLKTPRTAVYEKILSVSYTCDNKARPAKPLEQEHKI